MPLRVTNIADIEDFVWYPTYPGESHPQKIAPKAAT